MVDTMMWLAQAEPREKIERICEIGATKGGVLEKALTILKEDLQPLFKNALVSRNTEWQAPFRQLAIDMVERVYEHGKTLNRG